MTKPTETLVERLEALNDETMCFDGKGTYQLIQDAATEITRLQELCERLKREAECHAQEARTANATIREIYQVVTGKTGEPGNWNGAKPVKEAFTRLQAELDEAKSVVQQADDVLASGIYYTRASSEDDDREVSNWLYPLDAIDGLRVDFATFLTKQEKQS